MKENNKIHLSCIIISTMENKKESTNLHPIKGNEKRDMDDSDLECEPKQNINLSQTVCIGQSEDGGTHHSKSYNSIEINTKVDPLSDPIPVLVVGGEKKSGVPENQCQDPNTLPGNTSGANDESSINTLKKQIHDENEGSESGERQILVFNLKDKGGKNECGKDNSEVLMRLREGVCDLAKACAMQENVEKLKDLPDEHLRSICTTRREDAESCCDNPSAEDGVENCSSQSDLAPANVEVMEGCKSCAHINKWNSKQPTVNTQTQTESHVSRTIVTDTNTSTHTTCSSQTATMGHRNTSAQADNIRRIIVKPWAARKYNDICMCAELGTPCTCANRNGSSWEMFLPHNSSWWPIVKKVLLIIAALIPWVLLIVYSIYYYRNK